MQVASLGEFISEITIITHLNWKAFEKICKIILWCYIYSIGYIKYWMIGKIVH